MMSEKPNKIPFSMKMQLFHPILHGLFRGRERMGEAVSAHLLQNVSKAYLSYEIDVEQLFCALLLDTNSLRVQNYHLG